MITAISNVRIFDGNTIQELSTVIIDGDLIGTPDAVPNKTIDAQGAVLLPGLIDCHIHLSGLKDLQQMAKFGVTTALDMATWPAERLKSLRNIKNATDIRSCGLAATAPGSVHSRIPTMPREALVSDAADAKRFVAEQVANGADYIKIVADVPGPDQETLNALVNAAHRSGKQVIAHAVTSIAVSMAQAARVDYLTHIPVDRALSDQDINQMLEDGRIIIPTLTMMKGVALQRGADYTNCIKSVSSLHHAGVPVLAGTDANDSPGALHEELELLVECGLSTTEVLRSATCLPAKYFGLSDRGSIEPGLRADLVLIDGNPVEDITATRRIKQVWIAGQDII
ncbi:putative hydrolase [Mariannaea sp. PMI_226]|nr:putative hydrolase [Mariannaea sp. PMI_226]